MRKSDGQIAASFTEQTFQDVSSSNAVLRLYQQVFAVLARRSEAMILDPDSVGIDEAILEGFSESDSEGLTVEQVVDACRRSDETDVTRRFTICRTTVRSKGRRLAQ